MTDPTRAALEADDALRALLTQSAFLVSVIDSGEALSDHDRSTIRAVREKARAALALAQPTPPEGERCGHDPAARGWDYWCIAPCHATGACDGECDPECNRCPDPCPTCEPTPPATGTVERAYDEAAQQVHRAFCFPDHEAVGEWDRSMAEALRRNGYAIVAAARSELDTDRLARAVGVAFHEARWCKWSKPGHAVAHDDDDEYDYRSGLTQAIAAAYREAE